MLPILNKWTCLGRSVRPDHVGARFGLGLARGFWCLLRLSLPGHRASWTCSNKTRARFGFGSGWSLLVFFRWSPGWMPPIQNIWTSLIQTGASLGWSASKLLCSFEIEPSLEEGDPGEGLGGPGRGLGRPGRP